MKTEYSNLATFTSFFSHFLLATEGIENHFFRVFNFGFLAKFTIQKNSSGGRGRGREFCVFVTFACGDGAQRKKKPWASLLRCRFDRNNEDEGGGPQGFVLVPLRFLRMLPCIALACTVFSLSCC